MKKEKKCSPCIYGNMGRCINCNLKDSWVVKEKIVQFNKENGQICVLTDKGRLLCQIFREQRYIDKHTEAVIARDFINTGKWFEIKIPLTP